MRTIRQQDLCLSSLNRVVASQSCDNTKAELRWYHKSSDSALVGFSPTRQEPLARVVFSFYYCPGLSSRRSTSLRISCPITCVWRRTPRTTLCASSRANRRTRYKSGSSRTTMLRDEQETSVKVEYTGRTGNSRAVHGEMGVGGASFHLSSA